MSSEGLGPPKRSSKSSPSLSGPGILAGPLPSLLHALHMVAHRSQKAGAAQTAMAEAQPNDHTPQDRSAVRRDEAPTSTCEVSGPRERQAAWKGPDPRATGGRFHSPEISRIGSCTSNSGQGLGRVGVTWVGLSMWSEGMSWNLVEVVAARHCHSTKCPESVALTWLILCYVSFTPIKKPI